MVTLNSKHKTNRKQRKHNGTTKTSFPKEDIEKTDKKGKIAALDLS